MMSVAVRFCHRGMPRLRSVPRMILGQKDLDSPTGLPIHHSPSLIFRPVSAAAHVSTEATKGHNHTTHWTIERIVDVALLPVFPYAFYTDNVAANYVLIVLLGAHVHWGMEAIVVDYMRPRVVGKGGYYASLGFIYLMTSVTLAGLFYLNYSQMPPTKAVKKLWTL